MRNPHDARLPVMTWFAMAVLALAGGILLALLTSRWSMLFSSLPVILLFCVLGIFRLIAAVREVRRHRGEPNKSN